MQAQDFVTPEAQYTQHAKDMSGAPGSAAGMAPYPLYGLPSLGQEEATVAFYKRPWFCWTLGVTLGLAGGFFLGQFTHSRGLKLVKKNATKKKKA
jgi:hypothetical protein